MGKITSMHFTGWKLGLKTGMYYLRTQAAAQPIQFTVDQEALRVQDTHIVKASSGLKKRAPPPGSYVSSPSAVPRPMYAKKEDSHASTLTSNGVPTPSTTPPPIRSVSQSKPVLSPSQPVPFKADQPEGESPKALPIEPSETVKDESLDSEKPPQNEDKDDESKEREMDIYSEAVLACSIENPESCVMCSG